jgi:hypothetical protein
MHIRTISATLESSKEFATGGIFIKFYSDGNLYAFAIIDNWNEDQLGQIALNWSMHAWTPEKSQIV